MSTESHSLFEQGKQLLDEKKITEAVSAFAKAVSLESNNSEYRAWYAQALRYNQQYDEAVKQGSLAVQLDSKNAKGFRQRGFANYALKKYEDAVKDLSQAILIDKDEENIAIALEWRGYAYQNLEKYEMAIQDFTRAIKFTTKEETAYINRGYSYRRLEKYDLAIQDCTTALEINKNNSDALCQRGLCYMDKEDYKSAIMDFTHVIELNPTIVDAYNWRANSYFLINEFEQSLLDKARYHDKGGKVYLFDKDGTRGDDYLFFLDTINKHLSETFLPILKTRKESIVRIFPIWIMMWGHHKQNRMVNGGSFEQEVGTYGQGYVCLTTQNVYISSLGSLCNNVKKVVKNPLSFLLVLIEEFEYSKTDQLWSIPNETVKNTQTKTNDSLKRDFILLRADDTSWELYPFFQWEKECLFSALNMARMGKFNNIWQDTKVSTSSSSEIMNLIKNLGELRNQNIITEAEFESKKKELLSRL